MINLLALFIIIYIVVDTFYRVVSIQLHQVSGQKVVMLKDVESHAAKPLTTPDFNMIVERNIFGATEKTEPLPVEEEEEPIETLEETTLQLSLLGTIAGDSASARAIILDQKKKSQDIYRVGDSVQGAEIRQILRAKVVLRHGEKDEILTMVEGDDKPHATAKVGKKRGAPGRGSRDRVRTRPEPPQEPVGEQLQEVSKDKGDIEEEIIPVAQDVLQSSISNLSQLMTEVRVRPYFRQGKPEGLIVSQIQADSVFEQLGLLNGDIISSVNGKQISSPEQAFQLYNSLKQGSEVSIAITRRGKKKMLTYEIR